MPTAHLSAHRYFRSLLCLCLSSLLSLRPILLHSVGDDLRLVVSVPLRLLAIAVVRAGFGFGFGVDACTFRADAGAPRRPPELRDASELSGRAMHALLRRGDRSRARVPALHRRHPPVRPSRLLSRLFSSSFVLFPTPSLSPSGFCFGSDLFSGSGSREICRNLRVRRTVRSRNCSQS